MAVQRSIPRFSYRRKWRKWAVYCIGDTHPIIKYNAETDALAAVHRLNTADQAGVIP